MVNLTDDELDRYARHIVLPQFGGAGQKALKASKVALIGAGGIGAGALPSLVGAGIGSITIVDDDDVDLSNLQRQPLYTTQDVGKSKADLAKAHAEARNPHLAIHIEKCRVTDENVEEIVTGHDLVIDGTDNFMTRLAVSDACVRLGIPLIAAAAAQFQGQLILAKGQPCYRCFVGDAFDADDCDTCAELGVLGALTGTMGHFAALMAIRHLACIGPDSAGRLYLFDGLNAHWREIDLRPDPACKACAKKA